MAQHELAIDIGTSFTTIYKRGTGLVLREPTVAAVKKRELKSQYYYGNEAKRLIGKTAESINVVFPVFEGVIVSFDVLVQMLKHFLQKVIEKSFFKPAIKALISVPCGLSAEQKLTYENAAALAGIREVNIIDAPLSDALGLNVPMDYASPLFLTDIGGGTTDVAVVSLSGIIAGCSLSLGGNNVDTGIIDYILQKYNMKIGLLTAEKIKTQIGSLFYNDSTSMMISGTSSQTGSPESMLLTSKNINEIIEFYYDKIIEVVLATLSTLPPEVAAEVKERGLFLCGGGANVPGIDKYFYKKIQISVQVVDEPAYCNILGSAKLLADSKLMERLTGL